MQAAGASPNMGEWTTDVFSDLAIAVGKQLLLAGVYIVVGFWLARLARVWVTTALSRRSVGWSGTVLLARLASTSIRIVSIIMALIAIGVSATGLLAVLGAFTVAIGLSLQDIFKNLFAGIYLLMERPFRVGDRIAIRDVVGEVQGIDIRTTLIRNLDSELVLVPNALVFTEILRNDTHYGVRRLDLTIVSGTRSVVEIDRLLRDGLAETSHVHRPIPVARIASRTPEGLTIETSLLIDHTDEAELLVADRVVTLLDADSVTVRSS